MTTGYKQSLLLCNKQGGQEDILESDRNDQWLTTSYKQSYFSASSRWAIYRSRNQVLILYFAALLQHSSHQIFWADRLFRVQNVLINGNNTLQMSSQTSAFISQAQLTSLALIIALYLMLLFSIMRKHKFTAERMVSKSIWYTKGKRMKERNLTYMR